MEGQTNGQGGDAVQQALPPSTTTTPAAATQPAAIPTPPAAPVSTMDMGSQGGGNNFFKELDWVEVGVGALGALALYFVIYYYKNKVVFEKIEKSQIQKQLDLIKNELEELKSSNVDEPTNTGGF
jgi:hypothetical protein